MLFRSAFLGEFAHLLNAIFAALCERASPYASLVGALIELAGETARPVAPRAGPSQRAPSRSLAPSSATSPPEESLDDSWMEPQVFDGCSSRGQGMPGDVQPVRIVRRNQTERRMAP